MNQHHNKRTPSRFEAGQSLVETALGMTFMVMIMMGLFDLGRLYFVYIALEDAAGEAALYVSINPECRFETDVPSEGTCADPFNAEDRAQKAGGTLLQWDNVDVQILPDPLLPSAGEVVYVTLTYDFELVTPLIPSIAGVNPLPLTSVATQTIVSE